MMSRAKYRRLAEMSPGIVKPGRLASAMLWARPTPDSSMPPHQSGNAARETQVVDGQRLRVAAHPADLQVDDSAAPEIEGLSRRAHAADALVETDRVSQRALELGVVEQVVVLERLLDHLQAVAVQEAEMVAIGERVRGVGVDRERDLGITAPRPPRRRRRPSPV